MCSTLNKRPYQKIGEQLKDQLSDGSFSVGDKLPPERDIAQRMSVSRATVRDAMIMLELDGLVEVRKGSGTYVVAIPTDDHTLESNDAKNHGAKSHNLSDDMGVFEMLQARQLIESHIAEFAATQVTKTDILRLEEALVQEREAIANHEDNEQGDRAFHMALANATQNSSLVDVAERLWVQRQTSQAWVVLHRRLTDIDYREKWLDEHQKILTALKRRQPKEAGLAMWQHLESVKQTLLTLSNVDDPAFDGYLFDSYSLQAN